MMRRSALCLLVVLAGTACADEPTEPETFVLPVYSHGDPHPQVNFRASPTGAEEVPARTTRAGGYAFFHYDRGAGVLEFRLRAHIHNLTQAHIHMGPVGVNGGVVAWLYPDAPPAVLIPGFHVGPINSGVIDDSEVVGTLAGQGVDSLVSVMRNGNAYVNLHTQRYPGGEIRGQIQ